MLCWQHKSFGSEVSQKGLVIRMKKSITRLWAAATALAMVLATGCSRGPAASSSGSSAAEPVAMGRYVETPYALPEEIKAIYGLAQGLDGAPQLVAYSQTKEDWLLYKANQDMEWIQQEGSICEASGLTDISAAVATPEGGLLLAGQVYTDALWAELEAFYAAGGGYSEELVFPPMQLIELLPDGSKQEIPMELPASASNNINLLRIAQDGTIIVTSYNKIFQFDRTTGKLMNTYDPGNFIDSMALCQNKLAVMCGELTLVYDLESGEQVEIIEDLGISPTKGDIMVSSTNDARGVAAAGDDNAFYFANYTGLYRRAAEGGVVERLMDGTLVSLGSPTVQPYDMLILPDGILMLLVDTVSSDILLKKYAYDPTVPTLPDKELRIYSLEENKTIRQAISSYQLEHPDTHIVLEVGTGEATVADAIRTLNTQLLAGKGPDVLLLDNMPLDSYIEKKILLPLDEKVLEGMLPNLAKASHSEDGKLYAVPTRLLLPMMAGDAKLVEKVTNMTTLAEMVTTLKKQNPDSKLVLHNCGGRVLLNTLFPVFANVLYTDDKPDVEKLTVFLEAIGEIASQQDPEKAFVTDAEPSATLDLSWMAVNWYLGSDLMALGQARSMKDYATIATIVNDKPELALRPLFPEQQKVYIPRGMLGVNSNSQNQEAAVAFIQTVLSTPVQSCEFDEGFPVNKAALDAMLVPRTEPENHLMTYGATGEDDVTRTFAVRYPTQPYLELLAGWITELDTPAMVSETVLELLRDETTGYFEGNSSLADTMAVLVQKLTLLQTE